MPTFKITFEGRQTVEEIQRKFKGQLSESEILKTTARALNETAKKVQGFIRKQVRQQYTISSKYLNRVSYINHYAKGQQTGLYANVVFSYQTLPMIAFAHSGVKNKKDQVITVEIKKGKTETWRHAFIATMYNQKKSGEYANHEGIFAAGRYVGKRFEYDHSRTASKRQRITELKTASPFTLMTNKVIEKEVYAYIDRALPSRLEYFLQKKVDKMANR
jgi:hypothetical protein